MTLRKSIFGCHHVAGPPTGAVVVIILVPEIAIDSLNKILRWQDQWVNRMESVSGKGPTPSPVAKLKQKIEANHAREKVSSIAMFSHLGRAGEMPLSDDALCYLNRFTSGTRPLQACGAHEISHMLEEWQQRLGIDNGQTSSRCIASASPDWESITLKAIRHPACNLLGPLEFDVAVPDSLAPGVTSRRNPLRPQERSLQQILVKDCSTRLRACVWIR